MNKIDFKIGFSEIGGIYIGKNIQSNFHKHYAITILLSFGEAFKITTTDGNHESHKVAVIQKNISYNLHSSENDHVAFIHIVPYSDNGIRLSNNKCSIQDLNINAFESVLKELKEWFKSSDNDTKKVENLLNEISLIPPKSNSNIKIDERIKKSFSLIMNSESEKLPISEVANSVNLSSSHFAHLFKKETAMTFRKFVLHSKLIKSIYGMYEQNSLTESSFIGGFSDQAHFTRTFKNAFGLKPSSTRK